MNEIQQWIASDKSLSDMLVEIQTGGLSVTAQAEEAFQKISAYYGLPKMPEDIDDADDADDEYQERPSVYQILGMLKYLQPSDDPRGLVLSAIWYVKHGYTIDINDVLKKRYGKKVPANVGIGFIKDNSEVEIIFIEASQNWFDLGCKLFMKSA